MRNKDIATEAAIRIISTLTEDYNISIEKLFDFLDSNNNYRSLLNDDDTLICMLHDDSIYSMISLMGEQING